MKDKPKPTRRKWRNTFGAERRTPSWRKRSRHGFYADIVALQGVKTVSEVRRLFPALTHQLLVSRAAISELRGEISGSRAQDTSGFTAVVVRSRTGLRVSGQHNFTAPALSPSLPHRAAPIVALRLSVNRDAVWVLSIAFRSDCGATASDGKPDCDSQRLMSDEVYRWIERTRAAGTPIIATGTFDQLRARLGREPSVDAAQTGPTTCAETRPDILLIPGGDADLTSTLKLRRRPPLKKLPCVARSDIGPIGQRGWQ
ncbi:MAG: hypothetical protein ACR2OV_06940 [Hyphomicrobiaceae bacterium]